jgi:hypothetical protein
VESRKKFTTENLPNASGILNSFDVAMPNQSLNNALTAHSTNNDFASRLIIDISHSKARLTEEYCFYPKCVYHADANAYLFAD